MTTLNATTLDTLAARIAEIPGVTSAKSWKGERIYVELSKKNGGRTWNRGTGATFVVSLDGSVAMDRRSQWAGAATRSFHRDAETIEKIEAAVAEAMAD